MVPERRHHGAAELRRSSGTPAIAQEFAAHDGVYKLAAERSPQVREAPVHGMHVHGSQPERTMHGDGCTIPVHHARTHPRAHPRSIHRCARRRSQAIAARLSRGRLRSPRAVAPRRAATAAQVLRAAALRLTRSATRATSCTTLATTCSSPTITPPAKPRATERRSRSQRRCASARREIAAATTLCGRGCNPECQRLQPSVPNPQP